MIQMVATVGGKRTLFLGLERKNTEKLHQNLPLHVDVKELVADLPDMAEDPITDIVVWAGETLEDAYNELRKNVPALPPYQEQLDLNDIQPNN